MAILCQERYPLLLATFAYPAIFKKIEFEPEWLILDSGAFTAWTKGKQVDLDQYIAFCHRVLRRYAAASPICVNLDVIPGEFGRSSTEDERKRGMERSILNADRMRRHGVPIMEVFHQDEPWDFLDFLMERRRPGEVLGLSPRNDVAGIRRLEWMREVYAYMAQKLGGIQNVPPCHGLAATQVDMLRDCPLYSVDSSSWHSATLYGTHMRSNGRVKKATDLFPSTKPKVVGFIGVRTALRTMKRMTREFTELWRSRGIDWEGYPVGNQAQNQEAGD